MKHLRLFFLVSISVILINCGKAVVNVNEAKYEPKIIIDGYVYPNQKVENIRLLRNFPLNSEIALEDLMLVNADAAIVDVQADKRYPLNFDMMAFSFECRDPELDIDYGKTYRLEVTATVDGQVLSASAETTVPRQGFQINEQQSERGPMPYRATDESGNERFFNLNFNVSPDVDFYLASIVAQNASIETFIENNPYGLKRDDFEEEDNPEELLAQLIFEDEWLQTRGGGNQAADMQLLWADTWFLGDYRIIMYAVDQNFKDYFLTHGSVQDIDGNLYQPRFYIEGDGVGVFGSAVTDTTTITVLANSAY